MLYPTLIMLVEYLLIFCIGGFVLLLNHVTSSAEINWGDTIGYIFISIYLGLVIVESLVYISKMVSLFQYTIITTGIHTIKLTF